MLNHLVLLLLVVGALSDWKDDLVSPDDLKKFNVPEVQEKIYSGYVPVNEDGTAQFHYFFAEKPNDDMETPVTLWLNGGPGCSSAQGLFNENGPFNFVYNTDKLVVNDNSWSKLSHMLYLESPIGVGYSYGPDLKVAQGDETTAAYNLKALVKWFEKYHQYQGRKFYIAGESYAGIYIPTLASQIIDYNSRGDKKFAINLQGIMIGNGCTHPTECTDAAELWPIHIVNYLASQNMISKDSYELFQNHTTQCYGQNTTDCQKILNQTTIDDFQGKWKLNPYNVYGLCPIQQNKTQQSKFNAYKFLMNPSLREEGGHVPPCTDAVGLYSYLSNNQDFIKAIHVDPKSPKWAVCNKLSYSKNDKASYYLYPKLMQNGIRIWKFSGDADSVVPITGTLFWIDQLQVEYNLRTLVNWRPWYLKGELDEKSQVGGNYWRIDGLSFVSVKGAGHMVPTDKRAAAFILFQNFIQGNDLPEK